MKTKKRVNQYSVWLLGVTGENWELSTNLTSNRHGDHFYSTLVVRRREDDGNEAIIIIMIEIVVTEKLSISFYGFQ